MQQMPPGESWTTRHEASPAAAASTSPTPTCQCQQGSRSSAAKRFPSHMVVVQGPATIFQTGLFVPRVPSPGASCISVVSRHDIMLSSEMIILPIPSSPSAAVGSHCHAGISLSLSRRPHPALCEDDSGPCTSPDGASSARFFVQLHFSGVHYAPHCIAASTTRGHVHCGAAGRSLSSLSNRAA